MTDNDISQEEALKYIFKADFDQLTNTVTFNNIKYKLEDHENLYLAIYKSETERPLNEQKQETTREIDAEIPEEVYKITEEQFLKWKKDRNYLKNQEKIEITGKSIWENKKAEEPVEI